MKQRCTLQITQAESRARITRQGCELLPPAALLCAHLPGCCRRQPRGGFAQQKVTTRQQARWLPLARRVHAPSQAAACRAVRDRRGAFVEVAATESGHPGAATRQDLCS